MEDIVQEVKTVSFSVSPVWLTDHVRNLWAEGRYKLAMDTLDCLIGLPDEIKRGVIRGTWQLTEEHTWVEDDWDPKLDMCFAGQYPDPDKLYELAERGAHLERDVERLEDMCIGFIKRLMREGRGEGESLADLEWYLEMYFSDEAVSRNEVEKRVMYRAPSGDNIRLVYGNFEEGYVGRVGYAGDITGADLRNRMLGLPSVDEFVERQLELDDKPLPEPNTELASDNGYITPDGKLYPCLWMEHMWLADVIEEELGIEESQLVKVGRSQLSDVLGVYDPGDDFVPTGKQSQSVVIWMGLHGMDPTDWTERYEDHD
jgi:hypothetical protein